MDRCQFGPPSRKVQLAVRVFRRTAKIDTGANLRAFAKKAGYKIVGVHKETASGAKDDRSECKKILALAQARKIDIILVTELGQRVKADRHAPRVLKLVEAGQSYREISHRLGISKNTVLGIVKRDRAA